ncbi:hypothetical protein AVEN_273030-1 [Araneus ventricosus]|uniref:Uncharacterized protein n=1 Tax=Araneus ventricosus TaxID=182803 RepID=A0A4Y2H844_ARAVE|nr:hypothetical protein AVEN_273030-1 [Araneus ventricosus]
MDDATSPLQHSLPSRASCYTGGLSLGKQDQTTGLTSNTAIKNGERTSQEGNIGGNPHIHPSAKKPYQVSATKRIHHLLAKRMGQWKNIKRVYNVLP